MKNLFLLLIVICSSLSNLLAQTKHITSEEFFSELQSAAMSSDKMNTRIVTITKMLSKDIEIQNSFSMTERFSGQKKTRSVNRIEENGKLVEDIETIEIDNIKFLRSGNGNWERVDIASENSKRSNFKVETSPLQGTSLKQYFVFDEKHNDHINKVFSSYKVTLFENIMYFSENQYWVNSNGLVTKSTTKESTTVPSNITSMTIRTYEHNPKDMKPIEPPIK